MSRIAIIGSGSWGTALALTLARRGSHSLSLWSHSEQVARSIATLHENAIYLPGIVLPAGIVSTTDIAEAVRGAEIIIGAVPAQHVREIYRAMAPLLHPSQALVSAAKGIEESTLLRMSEVIGQIWTESAQKWHPRLAVISGPSFAREVALGLPTAITVASEDINLALQIQEEFGSPALRLYTNDDVIGVELGGALKNVIALAAGVASGLELGHNAVAALLTRGIAEITRLSVACGGRAETLAGLAGAGDLVLTATGPLSRNRFVGIELGRGRKLPQIIESLHGKVAEGVKTTSAALGLARSHGVEMPISEQVSAILDGEKSPQAAIEELMARPGRDEQITR